MPCITLLSDLGLQDASVAIAKGILMQHNADMPIADISHEVRPFNAAEAAYLLSCAWRNFPGGSYHVLLFDIFSERTAKVTLSEYEGHYFFSADNGVLPLSLGMIPRTWLAPSVTNENSFVSWLHTVGTTIQKLENNSAANLQLATYQLRQASANSVVVEGNTMLCSVIHIDHYENVVLNVKQQQFEEIRAGRAFRLEFVQVEEITDMSGSYADVRPGSRLCRFNSNGYLEICVNRGNAASLFGLRQGSKDNDIKIIFE